MFRADRQHDRQADRRPHRVTAADPVPEAEHPVAGDAKGRDFLQRRGNRGEMGTDGGLAQGARDPAPGGLRVGHGLGGGEGFRGDDDQRAGRVQPPDGVGQMRGVHVGDEVQTRPVMIRRQRGGDHRGAEIRTADADVDDIGECFAAGGGDFAGADGGREAGKAAQH